MAADREEALRRRAENEVSLAAHRQNKRCSSQEPQPLPQPTSEPCERPTTYNLTSERQRTSKIKVCDTFPSLIPSAARCSMLSVRAPSTISSRIFRRKCASTGPC